MSRHIIRLLLIVFIILILTKIPIEAAKVDAGINTKMLKVYLQSIYGKKILAGQQVSQGFLEVEAIKKVTGNEPALLGFDFLDYSPSMVERGAQGVDTDLAIQWWHQGGLITFCWHWNAPGGLIDKRPDRKWYDAYNTDATTFNFAKGIYDNDSKEYQLLIRDIDAIARQLKRLQSEGAPILWRPLHEASGGWFWWGSQGPEPYIKLWKLVYKRLTEYHHLNNLIWVWNGEDIDWYPGDDMVDIVGIDYYGPKRDYSPLKEEYILARSYTDGDKMVALTETGVIPDPDLLLKDGVKWLWYTTWCSEAVLSKNQKKYSEEYTEKWMLKKVYHHDYVITKNELPGFLMTASSK